VATVRSVERRIEKIEGFPVVIRHLDGRNVRDDRTRMPHYPFDRAMKNGSNITAWKLRRFYPTYPGFEVDVVGRDRQPKHGGTRLGSVRDDFLD
jgi:hypothetical protein